MLTRGSEHDVGERQGKAQSTLDHGHRHGIDRGVEKSYTKLIELAAQILWRSVESTSFKVFKLGDANDDKNKTYWMDMNELDEHGTEYIVELKLHIFFWSSPVSRRRRMRGESELNEIQPKSVL